MNEAKPKLTFEDLSQFTGDIQRYKTIKPYVVYTPGLKYLAEHGEAYWLIDAIVSYFGSVWMELAILKDPQIGSLHFWRLEVSADNSARLIAQADSTVEPFIVQEIPYTDYPLQHASIWAGFDGTRWTLYLPSEH